MDTVKVRVLEVNIDDQGNGGVYSLVKNVIENKPKHIQIDIAALEPFEKKENIKYLNSLSSNVYYMGYDGNKIKKQHVIYKKMLNLLQKKKYDVVHIHADVANKLLISGLAAKKCGVPKIILHAHATGTDGNNRELKEKIHRLCTKRLTSLGAEYAACSYAAAKWMFPTVSKSKIIIIKNGIDLKKYSYNHEERKIIRKELGLNDDDFLIGHVGRFMYQKNHQYLIKVFDKFLESINNEKNKAKVKLLLVGEGELKKETIKEVKARGLTGNVIFYGLSDRVNELMQGMDAFVLPSHFEGLPIVGIEAQAAGLPVLFSDKVTREARLVKDVKFISINDNSIDKWVENLLKIKDAYIRKDNYEILRKKGYGIDSTIDSLFALYTDDFSVRNIDRISYYKLSDVEIKEELFNILSAFADYCDENGLKYSLCGGTLLGAVRHKDFIPWDDDIDVFLSRPDYVKLHKLIKKKPIGDNYRLKSLQNGRLSLPFARITDTSTIIDEKYYIGNEHLWIDIFPVDGMPKTEVESYKMLDKIMQLKRFLGWALAKPGTGSTKLRTMARNIVMIIPKIKGAKYYSKKINNLAVKNDYNSSKYVGSAVWAISRGERFLKKQYENVCEVDFHGRKFHAPEYHAYLTGLYGDYMTLPPEKDRKSHSITAYKKK